jgi:7-carboxy-7-deazaguanine synthase
MIGIQEFEKEKIPVAEIFQSISGEGISAGNLVSFVRVAGCNLRCTWCDTKYSFIESGNGVRDMEPDDIVEELYKIGCNEIICTGGEPLEEGKAKRYLPAYLASNDFSVRIETGGGSKLYSNAELRAYNIKRDDIIYCMDIKCPGSGMEHKNLFENIPLLLEEDELKFVVQDKKDLNYALEIIKSYAGHLSEQQIAINISPVFGVIQPVEIVSFLKENNSYFEENDIWTRLSLQIHKFIWPPHQRGV